MNIRKLTSTLAKLEKTKSQAKIQAIRSIVGHLSDILSNDYKDYDDYWIYGKTVKSLVKNGNRRAKRKKK